jgi:hypothetical protein
MVHKKSLKPSNVCCIYATAPFIGTKDLKRGLKRDLKNLN